MVRQQKQRVPATEPIATPLARRPRGRPRRFRIQRQFSPLELQARLGPRLAEAVAASWQGCSLREMRGHTRSEARIAEARQVGMYLAHTLFRLSMTRTGAVFGRDRTTVRHACQLIEDQRDRHLLDEPLLMIETALARWAKDFAFRLTGDEP